MILLFEEATIAGCFQVIFNEAALIRQVQRIFTDNIENYLPWKMPKETITAFAAPLEHQQPLESD